MSTLKTLKNQINERIEKLDSYLNGKEITRLVMLHHHLEMAEEAIRETDAFLKVVPVGEYDGDRRKYDEKVNNHE